jgi:hypothetical protein
VKKPQIAPDIISRSALVSGVLAILVIWAGATKAHDPKATLNSVLQYQIISGNIAYGLAAYIPWLEITLGTGLIWSRTRLMALKLTTILILIFSSAVAYASLHGTFINCGCFGSSTEASNPIWILLRNAAMIGLCLYELRRASPPSMKPRNSHQKEDPQAI